MFEDKKVQSSDLFPDVNLSAGVWKRYWLQKYLILTKHMETAERINLALNRDCQ